MATTKKKPVTKAAPKKPTTARKATVKSAPKKTKAAVTHQSFRPSAEKTPFMTFKFTEQSAYWLILSVLVLALGAWVMYLNVKIQNIYDQVELNTQLHESYVSSPAVKQPAAE